MNKRTIGKEREDQACAFLEEQGMVILERNFFSRQGEIDVIARDGSYVVFVEVKYRKQGSAGHPEEAVNYRKIERIRRTAMFYLVRHGLPENTPVRFDVVAIEGEEFRHYENAF